MKKQIILFLLLSSQLSAQNPKAPKLKTTVPCTEDFINTYKGKWLIHDPKLSPISVIDYHEEVMKRINEIQKMVLQTYPVPLGADVDWEGTFTKTSFADQVRYEKVQNDKWYKMPARTNPVFRYRYQLKPYPWSCIGANEMATPYPESSGANWITIDANRLTIATGDILQEEGMTIDGRPIQFKMLVTGKWKGYDVMTPEEGANANLCTQRYILIHRDGMLPYIPVARKQYLDRAIAYVSKTYDGWIATADQLPDKTTRDEQKKSLQKEKSEALKKYQDALEQSTRHGLLDSPAIVLAGLMTESLGPIFSTEAEGGRMLITENPNYFRKDLPKYTPQFFVFTWSWASKDYGANFRQTFEENFPIEKLQAMIDK